MRLQLLSDLHFEFHTDHGASFVNSLRPEGVDVLVLAGDICTVKDGLLNALGMFCARFPHVLFVSGNHEYYSSNRGQVNATLQKAKQRNANLHVLERDIVVIEGQRFLGATLWFPQTSIAQKYANGWSDFLSIAAFKKWVYEENALDQTFLRREMQEGDVVITHYLPSWRSVHPKYAADASNCYFVCDMEELIVERKPALVLHGHTHETMSYEIGPTRVRCNPFGYAGVEMNPRFNDALFLDVP